MTTRRDRAVLLLHGLCSSPLEVRLFARTLRNHGFLVVTPAIPGYGAREADPGQPPIEPDFRSWIDSATEEIDRLAAMHTQITICGVSLGATLALAVAAERSAKVDGLSLISTTLFFDGWNMSPLRMLLPLACYTPLGRFYRYRETPPYGVKNERVRAWIAEQLERGPLSSAGASRIPTPSLREADRLIRHVKRSLGRVSAPTLLIHAREDDIASLANVDFVRRRIGSGFVGVFVVDDSYHMITLDNDRDLAAQKSAQFFNAVADRTASYLVHGQEPAAISDPH
jgi:carboxylesterase